MFWLDVSKAPPPYPDSELEAAKEQLKSLTDVSLASFRSRRAALTPDQVRRLLPYDPRFVPQSKDLLELFDTTPDLTGADIDISRYIRDGDEHDITVFWRDCTGIKPGKNPPKAKRWQPEHAELCPVPVGRPDSGFRVFAKESNGRIWRWDYREGWTRLNAGDAERIFPGQVFLLEKSCGGYDPDTGWTGNSEHKHFEVGPWKQSASNEADTTAPNENAPGSENSIESSDGGSNTGQSGHWRTILTHSREVCEELANLLKDLPAPSGEDVALVLALQSHQFLDDLALAYFRAIAKRIRRDPSLLRIPIENIERWRRQGSISAGSERGIQIWERLIERGDLDALIALMTDPGEEATRWRQYPVFVGILTPEESAAIRKEHEANASNQTA